MAFDVSGGGNAAGKDCPAELSLLEAVYPTLNGGLGTEGGVFLVLGGAGEEIYLTETVVKRE